MPSADLLSAAVESAVQGHMQSDAIQRHLMSQFTSQAQCQMLGQQVLGQSQGQVPGGQGPLGGPLRSLEMSREEGMDYEDEYMGEECVYPSSAS